MRRLTTITYAHVNAKRGFAFVWEPRRNRNGDVTERVFTLRLWRTVWRWVQECGSSRP